jgi:RNA polymerase sigma factor (sigma-70 family)
MAACPAKGARLHQNGDSMSADAFATLYARHHTPLTRYLRRLTRNVAVSEDVAQHAWTRLLEAGRRAPGATPASESEFRALLFTTARNAWIDGWRRAHFESRTIRLPPGDLERAVQATGAEHDPAELVDAADLRVRVRQAIDALPAAQREVVRMWQQGEATARIAAQAQAPRDTVLSRKKYAFTKLRAALGAFRLNHPEGLDRCAAKDHRTRSRRQPAHTRGERK